MPNGGDYTDVDDTPSLSTSLDDVETQTAVNDSSTSDSSNNTNDNNQADASTIQPIDDATASDNTANLISPSAPENLRAVAYTDTEIELFWDRSIDPSVTQYRVSRDGDEIVVIDALSYFSNTVEPGQTYEYAVQSVDGNGNLGEPASVFITTPQAGPTINSSNLDQIITHIADISNGQLFSDIVELSFSTQELILDDSTIDSNYVETDRFRSEDKARLVRVFNCEFDGSFKSGSTFNLLPSPSGEFTDCRNSAYPDSTINGSFYNQRELSKLVSNPGISNDVTLNELTITYDDNDYQSLHGNVRRFDGNGTSWVYLATTTPQRNAQGEFIIDESGEVVVETTPMTYLSPAFEGQTRVAVNQIIIRHGMFQNGFKHTLSADFTVQSPQTGNKPISVTTPLEFSRSSGEFFTTGQMMLSANDGSAATIEADTGDANTVSVSLTSDGITTNDVRDWSEATRRLLSIPTE